PIAHNRWPVPALRHGATTGHERAQHLPTRFRQSRSAMGEPSGSNRQTGRVLARSNVDGHSVHAASALHLLRFLNRLAGYDSEKCIFTAATTFATVRSTASGILFSIPTNVKFGCQAR